MRDSIAVKSHARPYEDVNVTSNVDEPVTIPHRDASLIVEYSPEGFEIGTFEERS